MGMKFVYSSPYSLLVQVYRFRKGGIRLWKIETAGLKMIEN